MNQSTKFEFIAHRINTFKELKDLPSDLGIEIDIRDYNEQLILQHDPFLTGEFLRDFLLEYKNKGYIIFNIKSERIEFKVLELIKKYKIKKYFFLDSSFPMIHLLANQKEKNIALRFSEYEGLDTLAKMKGRIKWVWVDCFNHLPLTKEIETKLHNWGYKICLVSPELQGREVEIEYYKLYLERNEIIIDAVCSKMKNYNKWMNKFI